MGIREFLLPDLGEGLEDAEIVGWHVAEGDRVELHHGPSPELRVVQCREHGGQIHLAAAEHAFDALDGPIRRLTALDAHTAFSPPLEEFILPNSNKIVEAIRSLAPY